MVIVVIIASVIVSVVIVIIVIAFVIAIVIVIVIAVIIIGVRMPVGRSSLWFKAWMLSSYVLIQYMASNKKVRKTTWFEVVQYN